VQSEVLDDATARALFVDIDPQRGDGRARMFRMSFDARRYDPADVTVRCEGGCLVVEARHQELDASGAQVAREFHRRIQLPTDVDPGKLTSTLSTDGILTVEAPVPPRYQAIVGQSPDVRLQDGSGRPLSVETRVSPVTVRLEQAMQRSRSPLHDAGGRRSPFASRSVPGNGGHIPVPVAGGLRSSPVPFGSLAPVSALVPSTMPVPSLSIDRPVITTDPASGQRRLEVLLELGRPYTAEDVVVRVDGRRLTVDARHEAKDQHGRVSTSTTQKQFDIDDQLDESTVRATLRDDGRMVIAGYIKQ